MKRFDKKTEQRICGHNATLAAFQTRPQDIFRLYITETKLKYFAKEVAYLVKNKKAYHVVTDSELETISESTHHEGVCLLTKKLKVYKLDEFLKSKLPKEFSLIALDQVKNPHNVGAIARVMAHFNAHAILMQNPYSVLTSSSFRTAEGGLEWVKIVEVTDWNEAFIKMKEHQIQTIATSGANSGENLYKINFNKKSLIFLGDEHNGLSKEILKKCDKVVKIPGSGNIESLNVSTAGSVFLSEYYRQTFIK